MRPVQPVSRDVDTAGFFDGTARAEFLLRHCTNGHFSEPRTQLCLICGSDELAWRPAAGGGTVISYAVIPARGPQQHEVTLVVVQFDEGPWWWAHMHPDAAPISGVGQRVQVRFERSDDDHEAVPVFMAV